MVLVSDNFVFSKCEKYIVVWAYTLWARKIGWVMFSSLFTQHKVAKRKDKFSQLHFKKISRTLNNNQTC